MQVDATELDRRIFRVRETVPVRAGALTPYHPRWLPGNHGPTGVVSQRAGLTLSAAGAPVAWKHLSPVGRESGRVVATSEMLNLQWNAVLLYPGGHDDSKISVKPSLRLPEGWQFGTALEAVSRSDTVVEFKSVSVETLIAVDGRAYKAERLKAVITEAKTSKAPIQLLVKDGEVYKTVSIAYHGGLRYPKLERIDGTEDQLLSRRP